MLSLNGPEVANAAADVSAGLFGNIGGKLPFLVKFKSRISHRFSSGGDSVMNKGAHLARLFLGYELQWVEVFNFSSKLHGKLFRVKLRDRAYAVAAAHERGPRRFHCIANRCDQSEPCDNYTSCQIKTPWKVMRPATADRRRQPNT